LKLSRKIQHSGKLHWSVGATPLTISTAMLCGGKAKKGATDHKLEVLERHPVVAGDTQRLAGFNHLQLSPLFSHDFAKDC